MLGVGNSDRLAKGNGSFAQGFHTSMTSSHASGVGGVKCSTFYIIIYTLTTPGHHSSPDFPHSELKITRAS